MKYKIGNSTVVYESITVSTVNKFELTAALNKDFGVTDAIMIHEIIMGGDDKRQVVLAKFLSDFSGKVILWTISANGQQDKIVSALLDRIIAEVDGFASLTQYFDDSSDYTFHMLHTKGDASGLDLLNKINAFSAGIMCRDVVNHPDLVKIFNEAFGDAPKLEALKAFGGNV